MKKKKFSAAKVEGNVQAISETNFLSKKNIGIIVMLGIVVIMVFSIFAISLGSDNSDSGNKLEYKGYKFVNRDGLWYIKGLNYPFEYNPSEVEMISSLDLKNESFLGRTYIIFSPDEFSENSLDVVKLRQFFLSRGVFASPACIKEEGCGNIPIVNCNNINKLVYLKNGNKTEIYKQDNCIVLESNPGQEALVINRFMYGLLGVI